MTALPGCCSTAEPAGRGATPGAGAPDGCSGAIGNCPVGGCGCGCGCVPSVGPTAAHAGTAARIGEDPRMAPATAVAVAPIAAGLPVTGAQRTGDAARYPRAGEAAAGPRGAAGAVARTCDCAAATLAIGAGIEAAVATGGGQGGGGADCEGDAAAGGNGCKAAEDGRGNNGGGCGCAGGMCDAAAGVATTKRGCWGGSAVRAVKSSPHSVSPGALNCETTATGCPTSCPCARRMRIVPAASPVSTNLRSPCSHSSCQSITPVTARPDLCTSSNMNVPVADLLI
mmetsp:Transcript_78342/g.203608  ORF Transcript_78342/g.203608 Transcript_78342/m.203608 type:complete len:284 (+) Transcript_78342:314-1165(+)